MAEQHTTPTPAGYIDTGPFAKLATSFITWPTQLHRVLCYEIALEHLPQETVERLRAGGDGGLAAWLDQAAPEDRIQLGPSVVTSEIDAQGNSVIAPRRFIPISEIVASTIGTPTQAAKAAAQKEAEAAARRKVEENQIKQDELRQRLRQQAEEEAERDRMANPSWVRQQVVELKEQMKKLVEPR